MLHPSPGQAAPVKAGAVLACGRYRLSLERPLIMGVLNITPDSFSDGGRHFAREAAIEHALRMKEEGADILDLGGESSRPGAEALSPADEQARVLPVLEALRDVGLPLSIDTYHPETMRAALVAGADMVNDINALRTPGALEAVAGTRCGLCLMHMRGEPKTMQAAPQYADVVAEVIDFLGARLAALAAAGVAAERVCVDPGFGFGKTTAHNYRLLKDLPRLAALGRPVLIGVSRKSMIGAVTGRAPEGRLAGSLAAAVAAVERGARIVRVHDVAPTRDALAVWRAIEEQGDEG